MSGSKKRGYKVDPKGRTKTDRFIKIDHGMMRTEAWAHLSPHALKLLLAIWSRHDGTNNGAIGYSVREAKQLLGCRVDKVRACFAELEDKGFLRCRRDSAFNVKTQESREWEITAEGYNGNPPGRDFKHWMAEKQNTVPAAGTDGTHSGYREGENENVVSLDGTRSGYRQAG